jgi:type II secretory pathway component PulC
MFDEITAPLFTTQWGQRAAWAALISTSLLLFYSLVSTLFSWHSDFMIGKNPPAAKTTLSVDETTKLIAAIPNQHIFGGGLEQGPIPITSLQLRLVGVVKSVPEQESRVIISESGRPGKVYQIGDVLPSGVKVYSIANDGVVLENGGRLEKLPLQRTPLMFQGMPKPLMPEGNKQEEE